jgi:uncharacterized membrane protein YbhN (UPF0104 family)
MWADLPVRSRALLARVPRRLLRAALFTIALGLLGISALYFRAKLPSLSDLGRPEPFWLAAAIAAQAASLLAYALMVQQLLAERGVAARMRELLRATIGGIALGSSLPGGQALSTAYWYKLLRREGAGRAVAAVALAGSMIAGIVSLGVLLVLGVGIAGSAGPCADLRVPILGFAALLVVAGIAFGRRLAAFAGRLIARLTLVPGEDLVVGARRVAAVATAALLNWLLDCACLVASLEAVGAHVPARGVLLTYALAQIVAAIPLLPGGGGTVELSLSLGFAAFGHTSSAIFAGVILYRVIACWGLIPVGWLAIALDGRVAGLQRLTLRQS